MCVLRGDILGPFYWLRQGAQFFHWYINGLGEILRYNGLRQIGLISLLWGFLFGAFLVDSKQRILFGGFSVVYGILLLGQECCSFNQYNLQDRMFRLISSLTLRCIMPCVSKSSCAHVIIISLWLYAIFRTCSVSPIYPFLG